VTAPISSLIRGALFVADLDRSTAFYRALGLTETYYEGTLDAASVAATLAVPATAVTRCRIVKRPGTPNYGMVGLFEVKNAGLAPLPAPPSTQPRAGEIALVFYVADVDAAFAAARAAGAGAFGEIVQFTMPHRSQREACLRDPDGALINVIERPVEEQFSDKPVKA
jgi:catechol 2,3-dioxygenase-like lactoylglutathione lyase family enzyme